LKVVVGSCVLRPTILYRGTDENAVVVIMERRVSFLSPTLGITLHRGPDGIVRVVEVVTTTTDGRIQRQGDIAVGDVLCEVPGIANLRNRPLTPKGWGRIVMKLKAATARPLTLYFVAAENEKDFPSSDGGISNPIEIGFEIINHRHGGGDQSWNQNNNDIPSGRPMHSSCDPNKIVSAADESQRQRQSRSLTPSKGLVSGGKHADGNTISRNDKGSSSGNGAAFSTISAAQYYLQKGTACLIPAELRTTNHGPSSSTVDHNIHGPNRHGLLGRDYAVFEAHIDCHDIQQMRMVSQISMDDELMTLQQQEDELVKRYNEEYEYEDALPSDHPRLSHYPEEHKDDDPRRRGPQPIKPPRYNPQAVPKNKRTRKLSF
jgi:hypothetical protein